MKQFQEKSFIKPQGGQVKLIKKDDKYILLDTNAECNKTTALIMYSSKVALKEYNNREQVYFKRRYTANRR